MAKEKSEAEKRERKELKKMEKRKRDDGDEQTPKKEKKEKKRKTSEEDTTVMEVDDKSLVQVEEADDKKTVLAIPLAALVPFANPLADDKSQKKVLKSVKKGKSRQSHFSILTCTVN
jgi:H/ACA ribonucleoprotein complex subunit 2